MRSKAYDLAATLLIALGVQSVDAAETAPSTPYMVCAAFNYTLAKQLADIRSPLSQNAASWGDEFGLTAIELDRRQGVPAEVAGNLITQLIRRFREQAKTEEGFQQLADRHFEECTALTHQLARAPIIQKRTAH